MHAHLVFIETADEDKFIRDQSSQKVDTRKFDLFLHKSWFLNDRYLSIICTESRIEGFAWLKAFQIFPPVLRELKVKELSSNNTTNNTL